MTEKVLFEFRATQTEDGPQYEYRFGDEVYRAVRPSDWMRRRLQEHLDKGAGLAGHLRRKSSRKARKTLDFLEHMYTELYGDEPQDQVI